MSTMSSTPFPSPESRRIRWGIIGTGTIAQTYATGVAVSQTGQVVAVGSRALAPAQAFAHRNRIPQAHASYEALLADPHVEAVYIATPHPSHCEWTLKAAAAKKHVLCEKPLGINLREAEKMFGAAREADVLLMEAFMYRCHPQTAKVVELVRSGALGKVGSIQTTFSFRNTSELTSRFWSRELGGGGILDVGCYPVSLARLVAGAGAGRPFLDPVDVRAVGVLHPITKIDTYTSAVLRFENDVLAQVATGVGLYQDGSARIYGTEGWLHVEEPWLPDAGGRASRLTLYREGKAPVDVPIAGPRALYALEADAFGRTLLAGKRAVPEMSPEDTLGNLRTMDRWREQIGLVYPADGVA